MSTHVSFILAVFSVVIVAAEDPPRQSLQSRRAHPADAQGLAVKQSPDAGRNEQIEGTLSWHNPQETETAVAICEQIKAGAKFFLARQIWRLSLVVISYYSTVS